MHVRPAGHSICEPKYVIVGEPLYHQYSNPYSSSDCGSAHDTITDFQPGEDKIKRCQPIIDASQLEDDGSVDAQGLNSQGLNARNLDTQDLDSSDVDTQDLDSSDVDTQDVEEGDVGSNGDSSDGADVDEDLDLGEE